MLQKLKSGFEGSGLTQTMPDTEKGREDSGCFEPGQPQGSTAGADTKRNTRSTDLIGKSNDAV